MTNPQPSWTATGIIEAPLATVVDGMLAVREGRVSRDNAPLLAALPGAGRALSRANLKGGPRDFNVHYGQYPGGTVTVDRTEGYFAFQGGYKFRAEYRFTEHGQDTLLTYSAFNVAPGTHQNRAIVRFQFWLGSTLKIGLRGALRRIGTVLQCRTHAGA